MKYIHRDCLRSWLNNKRTQRISQNVKTYCWKSLECELCKTKLPPSIFSEKVGRTIRLIEYDLPEFGDYMVLESVTQQNIKIIHVIDFSDI